LRVLLKSDNLTQLSQEAAIDFLDPLTTFIRELAERSEWPPEIVNSLRIGFDENKNLFVDYPDHLKEKIEDLEYGAFGGIPNAVIRPFKARAPQIIEKTMREKVLPELFSKLGVF
jgi:hypothetical protein